jgi:hypothetical protein
MMDLRKTWIILVVIAALALIAPVSAFGSITFPYSGDLRVGYISKSAAYNNEFGTYLPEFHYLGNIGGPTPAIEGTIYSNIGRCSPDQNVAIVLYITSPDPETYYSDAPGSDGLDHALVSGPDAGGWYTVGFEDIFGEQSIPGKPGDADYNDVVLNVTCIEDSPPPIPTPEFPTLALPAALIVGMIGAVLLIQRVKEN